MRKHAIWLALALGGLILVTATAQRGQGASAQSSDDEHARRSVGVNTLRAINTGEYGYRFKHGTFASWDVLLTSEVFSSQNHFVFQTFDAPYQQQKQTVQNVPQRGNVRFSKAPEILPGWTIRLNVTSDGKGYDVLLEDKTDKKCGYAVVSNESGLIRQSKVIDCQI
jgi:hypothetical protein